MKKLFNVLADYSKSDCMGGSNTHYENVFLGTIEATDNNEATKILEQMVAENKINSFVLHDLYIRVREVTALNCVDFSNLN